MALILAVRYSRGFTILVTGNESVSAGWYGRRFLDNKRGNPDLWRELGQPAVSRECSEIVVLQVPSHLSAAQAVSGHHPLWLVLGNTAWRRKRTEFRRLSRRALLRLNTRRSGLERGFSDLLLAPWLPKSGPL
eukprot:3021050-Pyramimonas_sp.AAC.1